MLKEACALVLRNVHSRPVSIDYQAFLTRFDTTEQHAAGSSQEVVSASFVTSSEVPTQKFLANQMSVCLHPYP